MARLQILELPEGAGDDRPPFALIVDEMDPDATEAVTAAGLTTAELIGARAVLVFEDTIDIPANEVTLDENGQPLFLKVHVQGEFEQLREQAKEEIAKVQDEILDRREAILDGHRLAQERTDIARDMDRLTKCRDELADALGMDRLRDWDDIRNAATGIRKQRDSQAAAIERVRQIHFKQLQDDRYEDTGLCASDADDWPCPTARALDFVHADVQASQPDA
jgi:hypothetical protein